MLARLLVVNEDLLKLVAPLITGYLDAAAAEAMSKEALSWVKDQVRQQVVIVTGSQCKLFAIN